MKNRPTLCAVLLALPLAAAAVPETCTIDPTHTFPSFAVERWGLSPLHGRFDKTTGSFGFDRVARTGSTELTTENASPTTGDGDKGRRKQSRDDRLRSAGFFNVREFPATTFKSTRVVFSGDLPSSVEGNLTLLGVTEPVTLTFARYRCGQNRFSK